MAFVPDSPEAVTAYPDTLGDLALGLIGGSVAAILVSRSRSPLMAVKVWLARCVLTRWWAHPFAPGT